MPISYQTLVPEFETDKVAHHGIYFRQPDEKETNKSHKPLPQDVKPKKTEPRPLVCLGYVFDNSVVYMGDVSGIPDKTWEMLESLRPGRHSVGNGKPISSKQSKSDQADTTRTALEASLTDSVLSLDLSNSAPKSTTNGLGNWNGDGGTFTPTPLPPLILIIDSLWPLKTHTSHYNLPQALTAAHRLQADMSYLTGFSHPTSHYQWEELCLSIRGMDGKRDHPDEGIAGKLVEEIWADEQFAKGGREGERSLGEKLKRWGGRVEPAWDGLKLQVATEGWTEVETRAAQFH